MEHLGLYQQMIQLIAFPNYLLGKWVDEQVCKSGQIQEVWIMSGL